MSNLDELWSEDLSFPGLLRQISEDYRMGVLSEEEKIAIKYSLQEGTPDEANLAMVILAEKRDEYQRRQNSENIATLDHSRPEKFNDNVTDDILRQVQDIEKAYLLQDDTSNMNKTESESDLMIEMPSLLRQLSTLGHTFTVSTVVKNQLKEKLLSDSVDDQMEAKGMIEKLSKEIERMTEGGNEKDNKMKKKYDKIIIESKEEDDDDDEIEEEIEKPDLGRGVSLHEEKIEEANDVTINKLNSYQWLTNSDDNSNPYIYMPPICWQLIFQLLPSRDVLTGVMLTCKSFEEYCDQRLFRSLVRRDFKREGITPPENTPDWKLLLRDTIYKWKGSNNAGDGSFNIKVYARFYTDEKGYKVRPSPIIAEKKNKAKWLKERKNEMKEEKQKKIDKKIRPKSNYTRKVPKGHPDYVEPKEKKRYKPIPLIPTILSIEPKKVNCWLPNYGNRLFHLDGVFDGRHKQSTLYNLVASRITSNVLLGINGTLLVYGQTGSGKTHTMFGPMTFVKSEKKMIKKKTNNDDIPDGTFECNPEDYGIIPRTCDHVLSSLNNEKGTDFTATVSYIEIYQNKSYQLAEPTNIKTMKDVMQILYDGQKKKTIFATAMNSRSSRAHTIFTISLVQNNHNYGKILQSVYHLVDLAGSERVKKSLAVGERFEEAKAINKSLSNLELCILRLSEQSAKAAVARKKGGAKKEKKLVHVPYHDSVLTTILKDSLGGNSQTTMIVCCRGVDDEHSLETLSTLRFGERAAKIKNEVKKKDVVQELETQIKKYTAYIDKTMQNYNIDQLNNFNRMIELQRRYKRVAERDRKERERKRAEGVRLGLRGDEKLSDQELPEITLIGRELLMIQNMFTKSERNELEMVLRQSEKREQMQNELNNIKEFQGRE